MSKTVSANDKSQNTSLKSVLDDKIPQLADQTFNINNWGLGKIGLKLLNEIKAKIDSLSDIKGKLLKDKSRLKTNLVADPRLR